MEKSPKPIKEPNKFNYFALYSAIFTVIGVVLYLCEKIFGNITVIIATIILSLLVILAILFVCKFQIMKTNYECKQMEVKLKEFLKTNKDADIQITKPDKVKVIFNRFEILKSKKELTYGYVEYKPFFWKEDLFNHKGIGWELLNKIFSEFSTFKLDPYRYPTRQKGNNWINAFTDLCEKKFDIILTPLFETRSRYSYNILYCSPIFYSNIGIYIRESSYINMSKLNFDNSIEFLKIKIIKSGWKAEYIPGEISETLLKKYELTNEDSIKTENTIYPADDEDFTKVLENVNADGGNTGDFIFMEVFKANMIMNRHPNHFRLVNILKDNQLLYPVSFVVRKEETVLKNLINIRLMEMRKNGELEDIIKNEALKVNIKEEEFSQIFIQKYDFRQLEI